MQFINEKSAISIVFEWPKYHVLTAFLELYLINFLWYNMIAIRVSGWLTLVWRHSTSLHLKLCSSDMFTALWLRPRDWLDCQWRGHHKSISWVIIIFKWFNSDLSITITGMHPFKTVFLRTIVNGLKKRRKVVKFI